MKKALVIDTPSLQSLHQRYASAFFTFIFWVIWIFLWTPLITLLSWLAGGDLFYLQMVELEGYKGLIADFQSFLLVISILGGGLAIWALYNWVRFRGVDRRTAPNAVTTQQLAEFFAVDPQALDRKQQAKYLSIRFDADGNIIDSKELAFRPSIATAE